MLACVVHNLQSEPIEHLQGSLSTRNNASFNVLHHKAACETLLVSSCAVAKFTCVAFRADRAGKVGKLYIESTTTELARNGDGYILTVTVRLLPLRIFRARARGSCSC